MSSAPPIAMRIPDAVSASGLGKTSLYAAIKDGRLPARKAAGRTLILRTDLEAFLSALPTTRGIVTSRREG